MGMHRMPKPLRLDRVFLSRPDCGSPAGPTVGEKQAMGCPSLWAGLNERAWMAVWQMRPAAGQRREGVDRVGVIGAGAGTRAQGREAEGKTEWCQAPYAQGFDSRSTSSRPSACRPCTSREFASITTATGGVVVKQICELKPAVPPLLLYIRRPA